MRTASMILPTWDEYRADAPQGSHEWATTDRGWCRDSNQPDGPIGHNCIGNYVRYSDTFGPNGETVHACAYHAEANPLTGVYTTLRHGSGWFHTIEDAKRFIETARD